MNRTGTSNMLVGCSLALAIGAFACGGNHDTDQARNAEPSRSGAPAATAPGAAGTSGSATANPNDRNDSPITLTGCLQKGSGRSDYILTQINTEKTTVGTSGTAPSTGAAGGVVGQEQMRAAEHAYKLNGDRDRLEPLVGKQVRVSGNLAKPADLPEGTSGASADNSAKPLDIDQGDLAKIDAVSVSQVGAACSGGDASKK